MRHLSDAEMKICEVHWIGEARCPEIEGRTSKIATESLTDGADCVVPFFSAISRVGLDRGKELFRIV